MFKYGKSKNGVKINDYVSVDKSIYDRVLACGVDMKEMEADIMEQTVPVTNDPYIDIYYPGMHESLITQHRRTLSLELFTRIIQTFMNYDEGGHFLDEKTRLKNCEKTFETMKKYVNRKPTNFDKGHSNFDMHGLIFSLILSGFAKETLTDLEKMLAEKYRELLVQVYSDPDVPKSAKEVEEAKNTLPWVDATLKYGAYNQYNYLYHAYRNSTVLADSFADMNEYAKKFFDLRIEWGLHDGRPEHDLIIAELDRLIEKKVTAREVIDEVARVFGGYKDYKDYVTNYDSRHRVYYFVRENAEEILKYPEAWEILDDIHAQLAAEIKKYYLRHMYEVEEDVTYSGSEQPTFDLWRAAEASFATYVQQCAEFCLLPLLDKDAGQISHKEKKGWKEDGTCPIDWSEPLFPLKNFVEHNFDVDSQTEMVAHGIGRTTAMNRCISLLRNAVVDIYYISIDDIGWDGSSGITQEQFWSFGI